MRTYIEYLTIPWATVFFALIALFWHHFISIDSYSANQRDILAGGVNSDNILRHATEVLGFSPIFWCSNPESNWNLKEDGLYSNDNLRFELTKDTRIFKNEDSATPSSVITGVACRPLAWFVAQNRLSIYLGQSQYLTLKFQDKLKRDNAFEWISHNILFAQIKAHVGRDIDSDKINKYLTSKFRNQRERDRVFNEMNIHQKIIAHARDNRERYLEELEEKQILFHAAKQYYAGKGQGTLERVLGFGATAIVFRVQKVGDTSSIAVKVKKSVSDDEEFELQQRAYDVHPQIGEYLIEVKNIIKDVKYDDKDFVFCEMEFVDALDGFDYFEKGHFGDVRFVKEINRLVSVLSTVMSMLNAKGIVHRDIKPENLLMSDTFVKLIDFGLANSLDLNVGSVAQFSPIQMYQSKGNLIQANLVMEEFEVILSVLDIIDRQYDDVFTNYYKAKREAVFLRNPGSGTQESYEIRNLAYMYRERENHFIIALEEKQNVPKKIIDFVRELIHGDLQFKWCRADLSACYGGWTWLMLQNAAWRTLRVKKTTGL